MNWVRKSVLAQRIHALRLENEALAVDLLRLERRVTELEARAHHFRSSVAVIPVSGTIAPVINASTLAVLPKKMVVDLSQAKPAALHSLFGGAR